MDTTQTETQPTPTPNSEPGLMLTHEAQTYLREAAKWASFLSIVGFIFCVVILVMALLIGTTSTIMSRMMPYNSGVPVGIGGSFVSILYILLDILYFFFPLYLYRFASRIKKGIVFQDSAHVTQAVDSLKSFFKLWGIVTVIVIAIYAIIFLFAIIIGVSSHMIHA
jgi:NADH:ubiquinone oxidoreductase subunit 3 (subunit A)